MSVDQLPSGRARVPVRDAELVRYDEFIDTQITTTRRLVKAVDVMTVLVTLAAAVLAFLLATAVVEHWFVPGGYGTLTRSILFVVLAGGVGWYAARRLLPLCIRSINPVYAAYTIEQGSPSLKNSLLNLLLFRERRDQIADAVYETLEQQAAQRLVRVPVEAAVDRTHLVRLGYVLVAVVTLCALYKIFSPKDPLVSVGRVLMPWSDIVPASRVSIDNVEPGSVTLARGEVLEVSAEVRGVDDDDSVVVRYTTADGQAVDRPVPLVPSSTGLRYRGTLPAAAAGETVGVTQDLRYRIEAGDARSREYAVTIVATPTIAVDRVDYDYPDYTGYADHTVSGLGDIRAIEGTRVTIHARANEPIEEAAVDFEADGRRDIVMIVDGTHAQTPFVLTLRDDRLTPKFTSYVLRFTTADGRSNRDPVKYAIDVLPDYSPEVRLSAPVEKVREVRLDETVAIEVEARDPDFALADVRVRGDVAGRTVVDQRLLNANHSGRYTGRLLFTPQDHGLRPGDTLRYWAAASDNRTPAPNEATSEPQTLRIIAPDPKRQPPPDRLAQRDQRRNQQQDGDQQDAQPAGEDSGAPGAHADGESASNESREGASSADESASAGGNERQPSGRDGQQSSDDTQQPDNGEGQASASGDGQRSRDNRSQAPGDAQSQPSDGASDGKQNNADRSGSQTSGREQRSEDASGDRSSNGARRDSGSPRESMPREQSPVSPDGDADAEAFERIRRFLERQRDASASADGQQSEDSQRDAGAQPGAETRPGNPDQQENADQPADKRGDPQAPGGEQTSSKGPSGAGDQPQQDQGAPDSQPDMKPADKWQQSPSDQRRADDQEPPAGGRGKRESDSQGEQGGDRAGGGQEGGGQRAEREGTGSAGQNQSADEGAGQSSEQGAGRDSRDAGQDAVANERTGQSGHDQRGEGSTERPTHGDEHPPFSRDAQRSANQRNTDSRAPDGQRQSSSDTTDGPATDGPATNGGAGRTPQGAGPPSASDGAAPEADAANLEYAREQTDLVLETLAEQLRRRKLSQQLLDELGWTPDDMQRFLDRWQQLKDAAQGETPSADAARRQLDEALRSLGLRRGPLQQGPVREDELRDLREGYRGTVPLEYQQRLRAYSEGVSRARQGDE